MLVVKNKAFLSSGTNHHSPVNLIHGEKIPHVTWLQTKNLVDLPLCHACTKTSSAQIPFKIYNHGQKSWDTFASLGRFPIHTGPTPSLTPQTMLDPCIQDFFRVSTLYRVGEGELQENFINDALF